MPKLERDFQSKLIRDLYSLFPGCIVIKTDAAYIQGFPDLIIFYKDHWAALECKKSYNAPHEPNQDSWVEALNQMSFARFINPDNKWEILNELQSTFQS